MDAPALAAGGGGAGCACAAARLESRGEGCRLGPITAVIVSTSVRPRALAAAAGSVSAALLGGAAAAALNLCVLRDVKPSLAAHLAAAVTVAALGGLAAGALAVRAWRRPEALRPLAAALSRRGVVVLSGLAVLLVLAYQPIPATRGRTNALIVLGTVVAAVALPLAVVPARAAPLAARALGSRAAAGLGLGAWYAVTVLAGAELLVRALDPLLAPPGGFVAGEGRRIRLAPHHPIRGSLGRANRLGYNDTEWAAMKPAGSVRVAVIGDSFVYGRVGYDANVATVLERLLRTAHGEPVEVLNLGIPATGPVDYLDTFRQDALPLDPDLVLVCMFVGNDFGTGAWRERFLVGGYVATADQPGNPFQRLVDGERWHLYHLVRTRVLGFTAVVDARGDASPTTEAYTSEAYAGLLARRLLFFLREGRGQLERGIGPALRGLEAIVSETRAAGIRVAVAIFPDECQVDRQALADALVAAGLGRETLDLDRPQRVLTEWARARGVPLVDLLPTFRTAQETMPLYLLRDSHWNEAGNRLAAEVVARGLDDALVTPSLAAGR